ncbi:glycosyltransferase family 2 protein [Jannaschia donghaensis]|uniref:Rhamnosyltransferase n=1 Tax=Jannaschia donghaensis TaxID=420998 RepID=A0A0M6YHD8_9RHOB|nr:glycosyltransferase family 2 protein [Jannaschia donghaensis]CTQ49334.1 rhamnosyltransferase [Jannaschia donghaensis]
MTTDLPRLGVVIVTHGSGDVVGDCLESLLSSDDVALSVVVVDNASRDDTADVVGKHTAPAPHALIWRPTGRNGGFAAGVNAGLDILLKDQGLDRFWVLNPDTIVPPGTARAFATHAPSRDFAMIGGRVIYAEPPHAIQIDGGTIDWKTGQTRNLNQGKPGDTPPPDPDDVDFVTGASLVVSRLFLSRAGKMPEDYFLYYEEVDWALQAADLPLLYCTRAVVHHQAGTSIGSPKPGRHASPFSEWFKHRARMKFVRRHRRVSYYGAVVFTFAKAMQMFLKRDFRAAEAILRGGLGMRPPKAVAARLARGGVAL